MKGMWKKLFFTKRKEKKSVVTNESTETNENPQSVQEQFLENLPLPIEQQIIEYHQKSQALVIPQLPPVELCRTELDEEPADIKEVMKVSMDLSEPVNAVEQQKDTKVTEDEGLCFDVASTATNETEYSPLENLTQTSQVDKQGVHEFVKRKTTQKSCCNIIENENAKAEDMVLDTVDSENEQEKEAQEEIGDSTRDLLEKDDSTSGDETPPRIEETSDMRLVDK